MISPSENIGRGMAAAKKPAKPDNPGVRIDDLEHKWSALSPDGATCAACGGKLNIEDEDEFGQPNVPIRLWKKVKGVTLELCLCPRCFAARVIK